MTIDLDVLEGLAKAATPGPWIADTAQSQYAVVRLGYGSNFRSGRKKLLSMAKTLTSQAGQKAADDVAFIASANPATVLALIAAARERDGLREAMPDLTAVIQWLHNGCDPVHAVTELSVLKGRIDRARQSIAPAGEPK